MHLLAAKIQGFKSFADKFDLEFDQGVTAVIGPNGSGKSNLAEAVRWVLGEQSAKQLRSKASTDVIFAGSAKRAPGRVTSVELLLSNESGRFPIEAAQVQLGRRVDRSGESEYTINGDTVRLLDIQHMLAQAGIGAKSYTVISQGMVDQYVTATPAARRELFEEATGVKSLQLKMKEALRKLDKARVHMHELGLVKEELGPRLKVLEREARRFEERETLRATFGTKQVMFLHHRWWELQGEVTRWQGDLSNAKQESAVAAGERSGIEAALFSAAQHEAPDATQTLKQELAREEERYAQAVAAQETQTAARKQLEQQLSRAEAEKERAQASLQARRAESSHFDWLKRIRLTLRRMETFLEQVLTGNQIPPDETQDILGAIRTLLETSSDEMPMESARSLLHSLEEPLKAVARAEALCQEYANRLKELPEIVNASRQKIEALKAQLSVTQQQASGTLDLPHMQQNLDAIREREASAERAAGAAQGALEQAQTSLAHLEANILREKGSQFLVQVKEQAPQEEVAPSEMEVTRLSAKLSALEDLDPLVVKEYEEARARFERITQELTDATATEQNITIMVNELSVQIDQQFSHQFKMIAAAFGDYFVRLFGGGKAMLEMTMEGVDIVVQLPGKKSRHIQLLSGGEKALTALALLFSVLTAQKPPFLVLDEVDAALDEANADRFARLLRELSSRTQCIVITHNRATMGYAHTLYGVTMSEPGISKVYSLKLQDVNEEIGAETTQVTM